MSRILSDAEIGHIKEVFRKLLGRELSQEEQRYLGLSCIALSVNELELRDPANDRRKLKLVNRD